MGLALTPNVKKLIIRKVSMDAIPKGGGLQDGIKFLLDKERMVKAFREAEAWFEEEVGMLREASLPNPYKYLTNEEIAGCILEQLEQRDRERKAHG